MAVGFNGSGEVATRSSNIPNIEAFTMCGWAKITSVRSSEYQYFAGVDDGATYGLLGYTNSGVFELSGKYGSAALGNPTVGEWFFFAITNSGSGAGNLKGYWAHSGSLASGSGSGLIAAGFTPVIHLGNDGWDEWCNVHMAYVRVWGSVLSQSELETEMTSSAPVKSGVVMDWPLENNTDNVDDSGNGYDLTFSGSLTTETGPSFGTINTRSKRASVVQLMKPFILSLPLPD